MDFAAPTLASETIAHIGSFEIRNTLLMAWLAMLVFFALAAVARGTKYSLIPGRVQAMFELVIEGLFHFFDTIMQNRAATRRYFPLIATFFLFIIVANWMGILPGVGSVLIEGEHEGHAMMLPLFRSMNADVNVTLAFAIISVIATQVIGIATIGILPHLSKYLVLPWPNPVNTFVGLLEIIQEFARIISFTFRLFGNIFAGEVLLMVISYLVPYVAPVPFLGLEIFVGFIQALVFTLLTLVFIKMSMTHHGDHDDAHAPAHA